MFRTRSAVSAVAFAVALLAASVPAGRAAHAEARAPRQALGGHHRQADVGHRGGHDLPEGGQRRGRGGRDARGRRHHVGRAVLGRGDAGAHLRSPSEEGDRPERAGRGAHGGHAGVLPLQGHALPAGVRRGRGGHAGHARRALHHAGRVGHDVAGRRAGPRHRDGRGLPARGRRRPADPRGRGAHEAVALYRGGVLPQRQATARRRARSSCRAIWRLRCASSWTRRPRRSRRGRIASRPSTPPTTASTRGTSPRSTCAAPANRARA